jgi:hypothetical protein
MPDGYENREDKGGEKRRAVGLQARLRESSPAWLLTQRPICWVDQAHREDHEDGVHRAELGQRRCGSTKSDVEHHVGQVDGERES